MSCTDRTCTNCKKTKHNNLFINDKGNFLKTCNRCIEILRRSREKHRCIPHGKLKHNCVPCGGADISCEHQHNVYNCKICTPPVEVLIRNIIGNSRSKDRKYNRYDEDNHIDKEFVQKLIDENEYLRCCYADCQVEMQFLTHTNDLCTIERINNDVGHTKDNCCLCCLHCNIRRKSNHPDLYTRN